MPNWVYNTITISGDVEAVKGAVEHLEGRNGVIDFNSIVPMPKIIRRANCGSKEVDGVRVRTWFLDDEGNARHPTPEERKELDDIGYDNWYYWSIANWGTKWNAAESALVINNPEYAVYKFETAWSPPEPFIGALRLAYPELEIEAKYIHEEELWY